MARSNQKHLYKTNVHAFVAYIASSPANVGLANFTGKDAYSACNRNTLDFLLSKDFVSGLEAQECFIAIVKAHPGTGTRGGKESSNKVTANYHIKALRDIGALIKV